MNQRIYMQIREPASGGGDPTYWEGSNPTDHTSHPSYWSEVRHITQQVKMDIAGVNSSGGPQASGRIAHDDMIVLKDVDRMTPKFYDYACRGQGIDVIIEIFDLTVDQSGGIAVKPNFVYILRGVSITSQKITDARTTFERREYNLTNTEVASNEFITGFTDVAYTSPRTIARETLTFLYSDLYMEIFDGNTPLENGFWHATKNTPKNGPNYTLNRSVGGASGRIYNW